MLLNPDIMRIRRSPFVPLLICLIVNHNGKANKNAFTQEYIILNYIITLDNYLKQYLNILASF